MDSVLLTPFHYRTYYYEDQSRVVRLFGCIFSFNLWVWVAAFLLSSDLNYNFQWKRYSGYDDVKLIISDTMDYLGELLHNQYR